MRFATRLKSLLDRAILAFACVNAVLRHEVLAYREVTLSCVQGEYPVAVGALLLYLVSALLDLLFKLILLLLPSKAFNSVLSSFSDRRLACELCEDCILTLVADVTVGLGLQHLGVVHVVTVRE